MSYEPLEWDSEFFGVPIGRILPEEGGGAGLKDAVGAADGDGIRCLYYLCPADDGAGLESALDLGFRPYDVRIELERPLLGVQQGTSAIHEARPEELPALDSIARERLRGTRFWNDSHFDRSRVADLYSAWLRRGVTSAPARRTLVAGDGSGFVICRFDLDRRVGAIELIAVAAEAAGRGLGGELLAAADGAFATAGCELATVVTQGRNLAAQRLYQRGGYLTQGVGLWLHRWRPAATDRVG